MTPIIGIVIALIAGLLAPRVRSVPIAVITPMLAATAVQSWYLGSGRGHNPASTTVDSPSYWIVQLIIVTVFVAVACGICALRERHANRRGRTVARATWAGWPGRYLLAVGTFASFAVTIGYAFLTDRPSRPGSGNGNLPTTGVVGLAVGAVALIGLGALLYRTNRLNRPAELVG